MKRFIRTNDNNILELQGEVYTSPNVSQVFRGFEENIKAKGNTIDQVIEDGDLVKIIDGTMPRIIEIGDRYQLETLIKLHTIIAVYTLKEEKYVPVWTLEESK